jgi:hypothetical protein
VADLKKPVPFDKPDEFENQRYKHVGRGETKALLDLPPGKHTLHGIAGWLPAALWAIYALSQYKTDKKTEQALNARG